MDSASAANGSGAGGGVVLHWPSSVAVPLAITQDMPATKYKRQRGEPKTAIHWGQRKLLLSEMELLTLYAKPGEPYWFVYAGAAPCSHMLCLQRMYARVPHTYELIDPSPFDPRLKADDTLRLRNEFFTNRVAYEIAHRRMQRYPALSAIFRDITLDSLPVKADPIPDPEVRKEAHNTGNIPSIYEEPLVLPSGLSALCYAAMEDVRLLFVSDIRSGSLQSDNFEQHVIDNMNAQAVWHRIMRPEYSLLKFRLPYMEYDVPATGATHRHPHPTTTYMGGEVLLPIWTRPTSTECRLLCKGYAPDFEYDNTKFEDQLHYFNATLRTKVHFNHPVLTDPDLDHRYDATVEVQLLAAQVAWQLIEFHLIPDHIKGTQRLELLLQYLKDTNIERQAYDEAVKQAAIISIDLQRTFVQAIQARDEIVLAKAKAGGFEESARRLIAMANEERDRPIWWRNIPEPPGVARSTAAWETTTYKL